VGEDSTEHLSGLRVSVDEAARTLGLTVDAVRKRVQHGQIAYEKDAAGRVRIILDGGGALQDEGRDAAGRATSALVEELRDRVAFLELELQNRTKEIRRRDTIIISLTEAVKALTPSTREASSAASRESRETSSAKSHAKTSDDNDTEDDIRDRKIQDNLSWLPWPTGNISPAKFAHLVEESVAHLVEDSVEAPKKKDVDYLRHYLRRQVIIDVLGQIINRELAYSATGKFLFEEDPDEYVRAMQRKTFLFVMFMLVMIVGTGLAIPLTSAALQSHDASPWQYLALVLWGLWALPPIFGFLLGRHYILPLLTHVYNEREMGEL